MTDHSTAAPGAVDLGGIDRAHPEGETFERLLSTAAAETAAGVTGVHHLGGTVARSLARASRALLGVSTSPGVSVARVDGAVTVDLDVVVEYPHNVHEVIESTRTQVQNAAAQLGGDPVVVNVTVTDVHGPFDPIEEPREEAEPLVDTVADAAKSAGAAASDALDTAREGASDAVDSARNGAADALESAADALDERRDAEAEAAQAEAFEKAGTADEPAPAAEPAAAEFVVRVEVEPADPASEAKAAVVEVAPVEDAPESDTSPSPRDASAETRDGRE